MVLPGAPDFLTVRLRTVVGLLTAAWLACAGAACQGADAPITLSGPGVQNFHVGTLDLTESDWTSFSVRILNDTQLVRTVSAVRPDCACTSVSLSPERIEAGESALLTGVIRAATEGSLSASVEIVFEDEGQKPLLAVLGLTAGWNGIAVKPGKVFLHRRSAVKRASIQVIGPVGSEVDAEFKDGELSARNAWVKTVRLRPERTIVQVGLAEVSPAVGHGTVVITIRLPDGKSVSREVAVGIAD